MFHATFFHKLYPSILRYNPHMQCLLRYGIVATHVTNNRGMWSLTKGVKNVIEAFYH